LKKKLKKEEELRKTFIESSRKKEDELKKANIEIGHLRSELEEITERLTKEKNTAVQRKENKINVLESKVKELNEIILFSAKQELVSKESPSEKKQRYLPPHKARQIHEKKEKIMASKPSNSAQKSKSVKFCESVEDIEEFKRKEIEAAKEREELAAKQR